MARPFFVHMPRSEEAMPETLHTLADLSDRELTLRDVDLDEFSETLALLPPVEEDVLRLSALGLNQYAIALLLGATQASISYRLNRARQRLRWLASRPSRPEDFDEEMIRLVGEKWGPAVAMAIDTTSLTRAAEGHGFAQSSVGRAVELMESMVEEPHRAYVEHSTSNWQILVESRKRAGYAGSLCVGRIAPRSEQDYADVCRRFRRSNR